MSAQLVLRQRAELVQALCCGGTQEGLESILDLLLSCGALVWEDYLSVCVAGKTLCCRTRELLDLVYSKGEIACCHLLAAFSQVLPDAQKNNLSFGKCSDVQHFQEMPTSATLTLLSDRPGMVTKLRHCVDGALDVLFEQGFLTSSECEGIQLPVYTSSQQVRRLLDLVQFKGVGAAKVLLQFLQKIPMTAVPPNKNEKSTKSAFVSEFQKKLCSSISAQFHFLSTYSGTGKFSLDDIYTEGLLELGQGGKDTQMSLNLEDVVGRVGTLNKEADTVLVSGEAGCGKSTFLQRLHLLWARKAALHDYLLLFPFSCRKLNTEERELSLKELLFLHCCWPDSHQDELFQFILDHPHLVLFTFDGLDEFKQTFSDDQRHCCPTQPAKVSVLFFNLLQGSLMKGVQKLVTSRTEAVPPTLRKYLCKEVLLKGFSTDGIDCFVRKHHSDPGIASRVLESLHSNTALLGLCHIPVFCWIVSKCYKELLGFGNSSLQTITDVYLMVLHHFFHHRISKGKRSEKGWVHEHFDTIMHLGKLALQGLQKSHYIFSETEVQNCGVTEDDIGRGFLIQSKNISFDNKHYEFLHVTMQCFFAALFITLDSSNDKRTIQRLFETECTAKGCLGILQAKKPDGPPSTEAPNLQITSTFVSGLLSQRHQGLLLQCCPIQTLHRKSKLVVKYVSRGMQNHFKSIPQPVKGEKKSMHAMPSFVWLTKCIYEMQDSEVAKNVVAKLDVEHLKLTYCNIGPLECSALAFVLQHLKSPVGLQLDSNAVGDVGVEQLLPCLHVCHSLYLRNNNISDEGIAKLVEKGVQCDTFKKIALFNNKLTDGCTQHLAYLLKTKKNFLSLRLGNNKITAAGAEQLAEGLRCSQSLQFLGLWGNKVGDKGAQALAGALENSQALVWMSLVDNGVGSAGAQALAKVIQNSTTLEELWLSKNCITRDGVQYLVQALEKNSSVTSIWLRGNNLSPEEVEEFSLKERRLTF
ncbi:nucleotide-binding oligomerization domain-containing protein 2 isoform X1 [Alosa pseudoharengus]|uniref:nucleotide-binding oligomerization domain-containing protein 2 isoform X1 n=1 Tax=Alosa pseudoharengus TaxID=34774 RepID=UPI003F8BC0DB